MKFKKYMKIRGEMSRDVVIVLVFGILIGCFFMYYTLSSFKKIKMKKKKFKKSNISYSKSDRTDEILMKAENNVSSYTEKGIRFTSSREAENFKTAMLYRSIKEGLSESQKEKQKSKKRIFQNGGGKLDHARNLIERNKFDMANSLIKSVLREGGKRNIYVRMAAYRYMADAYQGKGDVEKYSLMMFKYFKELEKNNINNEKLETIVRMKSDLMKTIQEIKKR
ncbi:hypothetical protein KAJ27_12460 [bacterium]|nr:hypothetical protein [bacterium]